MISDFLISRRSYHPAPELQRRCSSPISGTAQTQWWRWIGRARCSAACKNHDLCTNLL